MSICVLGIFGQRKKHHPSPPGDKRRFPPSAAHKSLGMRLVLLALIVSQLRAQPTYTVRFGQPRYDIQPGQTFEVSLVIDPVPAAGLHSYGITVSFDSAHA